MPHSLFRCFFRNDGGMKFTSLFYLTAHDVSIIEIFIQTDCQIYNKKFAFIVSIVYLTRLKTRLFDLETIKYQRCGKNCEKMGPKNALYQCLGD